VRRRERHVLRRHPRGQGLEAAPRRAARHAPHDAVPRPARGPALRGHEAEAGAGLHPHPHARAARPRRAHDGRRPGLAARLLEDPGPAPAGGADAPPDDALPRRGRALPAHRAHGPRPHPDRQHAGRAARRGPWRRGRDDRAPQAPRRRAAPEARGRERRPGLRRAAPRDARERGRLAGRERGPRPRRSAPRGGSQRRGGPAHHRIARRRLHRADGRRPVRGPDGGPPMTRSLAILLWVRGAGVPLAPADEPVRLTLAEAVEQARRNSPRLEELRALHTAADEELRGAKAGRLPTVDLQASYYRYSRVPELVLTLPGNRLQTVFPNLQNRYSTSAALSLPLYTGGRVSGQVEAARQGALATGKDAETGL